MSSQNSVVPVPVPVLSAPILPPRTFLPPLPLPAVASAPLTSLPQSLYSSPLVDFAAPMPATIPGFPPMPAPIPLMPQLLPSPAPLPVPVPIASAYAPEVASYSAPAPTPIPLSVPFSAPLLPPIPAPEETSIGLAYLPPPAAPLPAIPPAPLFNAQIATPPAISAFPSAYAFDSARVLMRPGELAASSPNLFYRNVIVGPGGSSPPNAPAFRLSSYKNNNLQNNNILTENKKTLTNVSTLN